MLYYYLDGLEKKGPYTAEEIIDRKLSAETLIFKENVGNWQQLKEFSEFKDISNLHEFEAKDNADAPEKSNIRSDSDLTKQNMREPVSQEVKTAIKVPLFVLYIFFVAIFTGISYATVSFQKQSDLEKINSKIDKIFNGRNSVSDFKKHGNKGILYDVIRSTVLDQSGNISMEEVNTKKRTLTSKFTLSMVGEGDKWNLYKNLVQYYECVPNGGFTTLHLNKDGSGFYLQETWSGDMAYKVPESVYHPGKDFGYGLATEGYSRSTFRPSISTCYEEAAKYLTVENEDKSYELGSYEKISNFKSIRSNFYKIISVGEKYSRVGHDTYVDLGRGRLDKIPQFQTITEATSTKDNYISNNQWIVWYRSLGNTYYLDEDTRTFTKYWMIYSVIGAAFSLILVLTIKYRKKVSFKVS